MCNTNPLGLFTEETQARIRAGEPQTIFHRNGQWNMTFIEDGIYMFAVLDEDGEHVEFLGDPSL